MHLLIPLYNMHLLVMRIPTFLLQTYFKCYISEGNSDSLRRIYHYYLFYNSQVIL